MTIKFSDVKAELLKNPRVRRAYEELEPQFELAGQFIEARIAARLTQNELAERMGSTEYSRSRGRLWRKGEYGEGSRNLAPSSRKAYVFV